jgi:hypothetical protein
LRGEGFVNEILSNDIFNILVLNKLDEDKMVKTIQGQNTPTRTWHFLNKILFNPVRKKFSRASSSVLLEII